MGNKRGRTLRIEAESLSAGLDPRGCGISPRGPGCYNSAVEFKGWLKVGQFEMVKLLDHGNHIFSLLSPPPPLWTKSLLIPGKALSPSPLSKASRRSCFYRGASPLSHLPASLPTTAICLWHLPWSNPGLLSPRPPYSTCVGDHPLSPPGNLLLS